MQNFQEKIRQVDSKVASLSAKVDDFERSHITADEMQGQVHEMREDLDRLRTRVERMKQDVKSEMVGVQCTDSMQPNSEFFTGNVCERHAKFS